MDKMKVKIDFAFFEALVRIFFDPAVFMWTAPVLVNLFPILAPILEVPYWGWVGLMWVARTIRAILRR